MKTLNILLAVCTMLFLVAVEKQTQLPPDQTDGTNVLILNILIGILLTAKYVTKKNKKMKKLFELFARKMMTEMLFGNYKIKNAERNPDGWITVNLELDGAPDTEEPYGLNIRCGVKYMGFGGNLNYSIVLYDHQVFTKEWTEKEKNTIAGDLLGNAEEWLNLNKVAV